MPTSARWADDAAEEIDRRPVRSPMRGPSTNEHPEYGGSIYDRHTDGSGVCYSLAAAADPQHPAEVAASLLELHRRPVIIDWLEAKGFAYDVITDQTCTARAGAARALRVVITGSHPEYYAERGSTRSRATSARAAGSCTWAATASTGASRFIPSSPG